MSKTRKPTPNVAPVKKDPMPNITPLGNDVDSLLQEWHRLQGMIGELNVKIKKCQDTIAANDVESKNLQNQGLQIMGAASELQRILVGLGVNPNDPELSAPRPVVVPEAASEPDFDPEEGYPVEQQEVEADPRLAAMRRRFQR